MPSDSIYLTGCGGYAEYGRNCTIIQEGNEFIILDLGVGMVNTHGRVDEILPLEGKIHELINRGVKLVGVCISHAHLDHIGAICKSLLDLRLPLYCTRFNYEFWKNKVGSTPINWNVVDFRCPVQLSDRFTIEYLPVQHSTPESSAIIVRIRGVCIAYLSDFKTDPLPITDGASDWTEIANQKVDYLICDTTSVNKTMCYGEAVAAAKLRHVMHYANTYNDLIILSTFSSHIARLKSIVKFSKEIGRTLLATRTYWNSIKIGKKLGIIEDDIGHVFLLRMDSGLAPVVEDRKKYVILCSGHQFEQNSGFLQLVQGMTAYKWTNSECFIQSARFIATGKYPLSRTRFEDFIAERGITYYDDVHESGHAGHREHVDVLKIIKPKHVIPNHANLQNFAIYADLAIKQGYKLGETIHLLPNSKFLRIPVKC